MSKKEIFEYFYKNSINLGANTIIIIMLVALLISSIIYLTYYFINKGVTYNSRFNASLVIILLISVVIMLMISSNIVISLGMVGALSIVRFRTAIKDSKDTVFIFWAITEGLSIGSQNFILAIVTTLFITLVMLGFEFIPKVNNKYLLVISGTNKMINQKKILKIIDLYAINSKVRTATKNKTNQEMIVEIKTKGELNIDIVNQLLKLEGVESVNYIVESGETIG